MYNTYVSMSMSRYTREYLCIDMYVFRHTRKRTRICTYGHGRCSAIGLPLNRIGLQSSVGCRAVDT